MSGGITTDGISKCKVHPCGVCAVRVMIVRSVVHNVVHGCTVDVLEW